MSYTLTKPLPTVAELHAQHPLTPELEAQITQDKNEIADILSGRDSRKILIIGPCSAWPEAAVLDYAKRLKPVADEESDTIKIIMRAYIQKPRTTVGWVGPVNQPDPFGPTDIPAGLSYCRKMMLELIAMGYPIADEAVYTHKKGYLTDLLSYTAIGARSAEDQEHRIFASMIDNPVGMKNPTSGNISIGANSIIAAQHRHTFVADGHQIQTDGNPYAHLILRGGNGTANCSREELAETVKILEHKKVENPAIIVDISHDNSIAPATGKKDPLLQPQILSDVLDSMKSDSEIAAHVKGFMAESFLQSGAQGLPESQNIEDLTYGKSITDGCLDFDSSVEMIRDLAGRLKA